MKNHIQNPVEAAGKKAGSLYKLAQLCEVSPQAVQHWKRRGSIPGKHVLTIERETGMPRHKIRPDLYPANEIVIKRVRFANEAKLIA